MSKSSLEYINAGYNYVNRFIVGIMLFKVRAMLRVGLQFGGGPCRLASSVAVLLAFGSCTRATCATTTLATAMVCVRSSA